MPVLISDGAPCALDATLWRECLKTFDYSPDKPKGACEKQRGSYYTCMKDWRAKSESKTDMRASNYQAADFYTTPKCSREAEKLHTCMMTGMFEISHCRQPMLELKACGYRNDEAIRSALSDDEEVLQFLAQQAAKKNSSRWWDKVIGKA